MIWYIVLTLIIAVFVVLHVFLMPRLMIRLDCKTVVKDRGLRNINEVDGHSIIYAPATVYRKYLKHYALSRRNGELKLICDYDKKVQYVDFDICLFDNDGNIANVVNVKQNVTNGAGEEISLPVETSYVSIKLNVANGSTFSKGISEGVSGKSLALFAIVCSVIEVGILFALKWCFSHLFGGVYGESFMSDMIGNIITFGVGFVIIVTCNVITVAIIKIKNNIKAQRGRS